MLTTDFEAAEEGITVPYPPLFDQIRQNHGFVDLRGKPDLAADIPEASQSGALKGLLVGLSESKSRVFTLGCDLGTHEEPENEEATRHVAGGYVQVISACYADRSPDDYLRFGHAIAAALEREAENHNWLVRFVLTFVSFKLDDFSELVPSLWIWFYAASQTLEAAIMSREALIAALHNLLSDDRLSFFEDLDGIGR